MSRKQTPFFATHGDLVTIIREVTIVRPVDLVHAGLFAEPTVAVLANIDELRPLETYLIVDRGVPVNIRTVVQRSGGQLYALDQLDNPLTVSLHSGGRHSDQHLIAGQIGTVGEGKQADELYALFARVIRKQFEKIKSFYVGPEAAAMLDSGARLSVTTKSPQTYDLVRSPVL